MNTKKKRILILTANPKDTARLRLDEEVREIEAGLQRAKYGYRFTLYPKWAVRTRDIQRAMLDIDPHIVHFSGHGTGNEGLVFEDDIGEVKLVDGKAIAGLFELFANKVEYVVLNGCYSQSQADAIAQHINYVIGMSQRIRDRAAIKFAEGFYEALGAGKDVEFAYKMGRNAIDLAGFTEHQTLILKKKPNLANITLEDKPPITNNNDTISTSQISNWRCTKTLCEHNSVVYSVAITPDSKTLVSGDDYGRINIWNLDTEELLYTLPFSENSALVESIAISPDGKRFASSASTKINLWNNLHTTLSKLPCSIWNQVRVNALAFHPKGDYLASGGDRKINLWLPDGERIDCTLDADQNEYPDGDEPEPNYSPSYSVTCVNFSPDGSMLAAGISVVAPDGETALEDNIKIWDLDSRKLLYVLHEHSRSCVMSIAFSPDGNTLASGSSDGTIKVWDVKTSTAIHTIEKHCGSVCAVTFSPDGKTLASSDTHGFIKLWDSHTSIRLQRLRAHTGFVNSLAFSADGQTLVSGSSDGTIKIWRCD